MKSLAAVNLPCLILFSSCFLLISCAPTAPASTELLEPVAAGSENELIDLVGRISMLVNPPHDEAPVVSGKEVVETTAPVPVVPLTEEAGDAGGKVGSASE